MKLLAFVFAVCLNLTLHVHLSSAQETTTDATPETIGDTNTEDYSTVTLQSQTTNVPGGYTISEYDYEEGSSTSNTDKPAPGTADVDSTTVAEPLLACGCVHLPKGKSCPVRTVPTAENALQFDHITAGTDAKAPGDYPWMALLGRRQVVGIFWFCGGGLLTDRHVMTAGHCVTSAGVDVIRLGEHDYSTEEDTNGVVDFGVERVTKHPAYDYPLHDVAMIVLDRKVEFSEVIRPLCLPPPQGIPESVPAPVIVMGWGRIGSDMASSSILKYAEVPLVSLAKCQEAYGPGITSEILCAAGSSGQDSCQGDSGGPLVRVDTNTVSGNEQYTVIGIVSGGRGCGLAEYPGLYTNVQPHLPWILEQLK